MGILKSLREAWLGVGVKDKSVGVESVSVKNADNAKNLGVVSSENKDVIEGKLDEIIERLGRSGGKYKSSLLEYIKDIIERKSEIYSKFNGVPKFKYEVSIDENYEIYHFEVSYDRKKVMVIDVKSTINGEILDFEAKYISDISEYPVHNNLGSTEIKIKCSLDGTMTLERNIYNLDLLCGAVYSEDELNDNLLSDGIGLFEDSKLHR